MVMTLRERTDKAVQAIHSAPNQEALFKAEALCTRLLADLKAVYDVAPSGCPEWAMAREIHTARISRAVELAAVTEVAA
jgi:hypothetical protein